MRNADHQLKIHYDRGQGPRESVGAATRNHSTTYVRDAAEAVRVAVRLERERVASLPAPKERQPGEDDE